MVRKTRKSKGMTLPVCIFGGLACIALGAYIGYTFCKGIDGDLFQAMYDAGILVIKTDNAGWDGTPEAMEDVRKAK